MQFFIKILLCSILVLLLSSCNFNDTEFSDLGLPYVEFEADGSHNRFTSTFAQYEDDVLTVSANELGGGFQSNSVTFHVKLSDGTSLYNLSKGSEDPGEIDFFTYTVGNLVGYETGGDTNLSIDMEVFHDKENKLFSGLFLGNLGGVEDPSDIVEITFGEFRVFYQYSIQS